MSSIVTQQGILHYETMGRGQPLILLHGWINSWDVWRDSMIALANGGQYRVYALDFWGFGESAKGNGSSAPSFRIASYVEMVKQFMDSLGIQESPLLGHSMGGTVALQFALNYPERTRRVAVVGSPVVGTSLNLFLKMAGIGRIAELVWRYPRVFEPMMHSVTRLTMHILLAGDSERVREMIFRDWQQTTFDSFFRSISDLKRTDLRSELQQLNMPTLGIYGLKDNIVSPSNADILRERVQSSEVSLMHHSRHFPMTDEPDKFLSTLDGFLRSEEYRNNGHGRRTPAG
ncbi:MAG: alpha/beta hydrolase [Ardenticatenaceae bacterium]|nr:alpha/beta hydrolase [Anaerolineales bacterium]MCB8919203.1 alpha/beta hydrolase [Ardenticatenaceae bacterium]